MTPEGRAKKLYEEIQPYGFEGDPYLVMPIITQAIDGAVEEWKEKALRYAAQVVDIDIAVSEAVEEALAEQREQAAKLADTCTKVMHCNVAAAIRDRK